MVRRIGKSASSSSIGGVHGSTENGAGGPADAALPQAAVQERRARVVLVGARPLDAAELLQARVAHAGVHRAQRAQLVPRLLGVGLAPVVAQPAGELADDPAVVARARRAGRPPCALRCTRRSLLVTVPSDSHHAAVGGKTTSAISAVFGQEDVLDDHEVQPLEQLERALGVGLGLRRVLAKDVERAAARRAPSRRTSRQVPAALGRDLACPRRASKRARASRSSSTSWKPGSLFGIAPMSPPPCTLFWPRSGFSPEP